MTRTITTLIGSTANTPWQRDAFFWLENSRLFVPVPRVFPFFCLDLLRSGQGYKFLSTPLVAENLDFAPQPGEVSWVNLGSGCGS